MQDLKNLSRKKRFPGKIISRANTSNRRLSSSGENVFQRLRLPTGKQRERLKHFLLFLAIVLALTPVCVLLYQKVPDVAKPATTWLSSRLAPTPDAAEAAKHPPMSNFESACLLLDSATSSEGQLTAKSTAGESYYFTIRSDLQKRVHDFMATNKVPYGVFVAVEPATGRILGMTSHSTANPAWTRNAFFELYPMASLFKIITATAALETKRLTPDTVVEFRGNNYSENPRYWYASRKGKNNRMDVTYAMGKSINPVYGRVASDFAGKESVMECVRRFGFNQSLLAGTPAKESRAGEPQGEHGLMLMGAGLDHEVKVSPLHAAMIMAAIANNGRMMSPALTDRVVDSNGNTRELQPQQELRRLVSPETASSLTRMLSSTVTSGTSRRAFHDQRGRPRLKVEIAAKTGSINGTDPKGHYSWFAAFAPAQNPQIALVALVINQDKWKIKASHVGEQALEEFFRK